MQLRVSHLNHYFISRKKAVNQLENLHPRRPTPSNQPSPAQTHSSRFPKPHLHPIRAAVRQGQVMSHHGILFQILDRVKALQQSDRHVRGFREGELLPYADAGTAVERQELPPNLPPLPPLGPERLRITPPDIFPPMHHMHTIINLRTLRDEDLTLAILPPATRERRVLVCAPAVDRDDGVEAQGFRHAVLKVLARLQLRESDAVGPGLLIGSEI